MDVGAWHRAGGGQEAARWQDELARAVLSRLPAGSRGEVVGSALLPMSLDGWSDLDLHLHLRVDVALEPLLGAGVWAYQSSVDADRQVVRSVLADGRRVDLVVLGGRLLLPPEPPGNTVRFLAAQAATKLGRGDLLIGTHLMLEMAQLCLVEAMLLRDRDTGSTVHRTGTERDELAGAVRRLLIGPDVLEAVRRMLALHDQWHRERDPRHRPDDSGLVRLIERGSAAGGPGHLPVLSAPDAPEPSVSAPRCRMQP